MIWQQSYDPTGLTWLSTLLAIIPIALLIGTVAFTNIRIHSAALLGLAAALVSAVGVYRMPWDLAIATTVYGAGYGMFPIGWIVLNVIFLYQLTVESGRFDVLRESLATITTDARVQLILIAFAFGAFLEGMAGFGTPVAITAAILTQLRFKPVHAAGLALIANTAPVAFGSLGIPITTLAQVTGIDVLALSAMIGRQLPFFSLIIPFWIVAAFAGWRAMLGVWPAALTGGLAFAVPQYFVSNFHGPWLVDIASGICAVIALVLLMRIWQPRTLWLNGAEPVTDRTNVASPVLARPSRGALIGAWMPWAVLTLCILCWGLPPVRAALDDMLAPHFAMPHLDGLVQRVAPVAAAGTRPEAAVFRMNLLSATGTAIFLAAIFAGLAMRLPVRTMAGVYGRTFWRVRYSLITIAAMLALGNVTKYSGSDATLGLALAQTGQLYPFFGTMLGWLGVVLTGSDTASNVLFGNLQQITAAQLGISAVLMCAANSAGGVMGKMADAQSIVVASTASRFYGHERAIFRFIFVHSILLASLVGLLVLLQAYVPPFTALVVR